MMKLYDMLDEGKISEIAEIKEYFLMLEREQIIDAYDKNKMGRVDYGEQYYNETYKGGEQ